MAVAAAPVARPSMLHREFARDVEAGLLRRRKTLQPRWLYDEVGSALFEAITVLPEYGLTRADTRIIVRAADEICAAAGHPRLIVELGSGSGAKTRRLLETAAAHSFIDYLPIDISPAALENCAAAMSGIDRVHVRPIDATYLAGVEAAFAGRRSDDRALLLFLGSTIGNFEHTEAIALLTELRRRARAGDALLLGADLLKPEAVLVLAYDDAAGVTAAFNRNLLARINRELGGEFDLSLFAHEAAWNRTKSRVEMHLRSRAPQRVRIAAIGRDIRFRAGETIWTESSHKFRAEQIGRMGERAGWRLSQQWIDREWPFAETLFTAA